MSQVLKPNQRHRSGGMFLAASILALWMAGCGSAVPASAPPRHVQHSAKAASQPALPPIPTSYQAYLPSGLQPRQVLDLTRSVHPGIVILAKQPGLLHGVWVITLVPQSHHWTTASVDETTLLTAHAAIGPTGPQGQRSVVVWGFASAAGASGSFYNYVLTAAGLRRVSTLHGSDPRFVPATARQPAVEHFSGAAYQFAWRQGHLVAKNLGPLGAIPSGAVRVPLYYFYSSPRVLGSTTVTVRVGQALAVVPANASALTAWKQGDLILSGPYSTISDAQQMASQPPEAFLNPGLYFTFDQAGTYYVAVATGNATTPPLILTVVVKP